MLEKILTICISLNTLGMGLLGWFQWRNAVAMRKISEQQKAIADSQRQIADQKLKLDLFDRRFKIYSAIREFASGLLLYGVVDINMVVEFVCDTSETEFFFDSEICRLRDDIHEISKRSDSASARASEYPPDSTEHQTLAEQRSQFRQEAEKKYDEMHRLFHPYLGFHRLTHT